MPPRAIAALQALFVTFLWSTSWVLIKIGLDEIPALTFAGLRYSIAALLLLPFALRGPERRALRTLPAADLRRLLALGVVLYALTQGAQFLALASLPAQTTSLLLSFSPVVVAMIGIVALAERPAPAQWYGVGAYLLGAAVFLYPAEFPAGQLLGLAIAVVGLLSNAGAAVLGRSVNRGRALSPLAVTAVSMAVGAAALLVTGVVAQGVPALSLQGWAIVGWLAVVNTAVAFTLWNHTQRTLPAMDSSVINNTMLIQIAVLAWLFLGEPLGVRQLVGLTLAAGGVLVVQLRGLPRPRSDHNGRVSRRRPQRRPSRQGPSPDRLERWPDGEWVVRPVTGSAATKTYRCPGCEQVIRPATPHVVAWPADDALSGGLAERRHWHTGCWRARGRRRP